MIDTTDHESIGDGDLSPNGAGSLVVSEQGGPAMRHLILDGTENADELKRMIATLREKQRTAVIPSTAREYADDADECLDVLLGMALEDA